MNHPASRRRLALVIIFATLSAGLAPAILRAVEDTPLHQSMETINDAFRELRKALRAPDAAKKDQYLQWVATIKAEAVKGKDLVPLKVKELAADAQAAEIAAYQKSMDEFIAVIGELEKAIAAADWDAANAAAKKMNSQKSSGHERFKKE